MSAYLLSMSLGSMFWAFLRDKLKRSKNIPYYLLSAVGILVPLSILVFQAVISTSLSRKFNFTQTFTSFSEALANGNYFQALGSLLVFGLPFLLLIFPVVFFSSGIFPTLIKNLSENNLSLGKSTGIIFFSNSAGSTCGSLFTGFIAAPLLGWYTSLVLISLLSAGMGALGILLFRSHTAGPEKRTDHPAEGQLGPSPPHPYFHRPLCHRRQRHQVQSGHRRIFPGSVHRGLRGGGDRSSGGDRRDRV